MVNIKCKWRLLVTQLVGIKSMLRDSCRLKMAKLQFEILRCECCTNQQESKLLHLTVHVDNIIFPFWLIVCSFHVIAQVSQWRADRIPTREIALSKTVFACYELVYLYCRGGMRYMYAFSLHPDIILWCPNGRLPGYLAGASRWLRLNVESIIKDIPTIELEDYQRRRKHKNVVLWTYLPCLSKKTAMTVPWMSEFDNSCD